MSVISIMLEYDTGNRSLYNKGECVGVYTGATDPEEYKGGKVVDKVDSLVKLKTAGFSSEEILSLDVRGLI